MRPRTVRFNPKRRIATETDLSQLAKLENSVRYGGNPEHKKNPGDFGLTPPSGPRAGKSLCDAVEIFTKDEAIRLIKKGLSRGLISSQMNGEWPQNIWCVTESGAPLEAQLENSASGTYHGYPMPSSDPLYNEVLRRWKAK